MFIQLKIDRLKVKIAEIEGEMHAMDQKHLSFYQATPSRYFVEAYAALSAKASKLKERLRILESKKVNKAIGGYRLQFKIINIGIRLLPEEYRTERLIRNAMKTGHIQVKRNKGGEVSDVYESVQFLARKKG